MYELLVRVKNPKALDETIQQLGGVVGQDASGNYEQVEPETYTVRSVRGDVDFLEFAIQQQGYGKIVGKREI